MIVGEPGVHLTYCTNIHAGETWGEVFENVRTHVVAVRRLVSPGAPFGVGLRLSAVAVRELGRPAALESLRAFLAANDLYVFTINGFPYGSFSGGSVKERVYEPDWLEDARVAYSDELARVLAALLPDDLEGSVSTVPGCFRARGDVASTGPAVADRLLRHALTLWRLKEATGRCVGLALEPEPRCLLETTDEAVTFFEEHVFGPDAIRSFARATGLAPSQADAALREHVGVCFDACHAAVEFEDPAEGLARLAAAGVRVLKVQVSAGLRAIDPGAASLEALERFAESVYLHQVVVRRGAELVRFLDLPEAIAAARAGAGALLGRGTEWRVHFHVPVFLETLGAFHNTQSFLQPLLREVVRTGACRYLEVETYTWDVLPEEHRRGPVVEAIARELEWTRERLLP